MKFQAILLILFLLSASFIISSKCSDEIKMPPGARISLYRISNENKFDVVNGVRSCGGPGTILEWRYEVCLEGHIVCSIPTDGISRTNQVDFITGRNIESLGFRVILKTSDGSVETNIDLGKIVGGELLKKGITYTFTTTGGANPEVKGKKAIAQFIFYNLNDKNIEMCAEADAMYV